MPDIKVLNEMSVKQNGVITTYKIGTIEGYLNPSDGKFYLESTYETEVEGASGIAYADLSTYSLYIYDSTLTSFVKVSVPKVDNIKFGYLNETDGKFYEEDIYTTEISGNAEDIYITLDTNYIYRYDTTETEFIQIGGSGGGLSDAIVYVNNVPTTDIKNVFYGIISESSHTETITDGFLDENDLFEKTAGSGSDYTYTPAEGIELQASTDGTTYKGFTSLAYDGSSVWTLTFEDTTTASLNNADTFYFKQIFRLYYAGNEDEQTVTLLAAGSSGGGGGGVTYLPGEGIDITNDIISVAPATSSTLGGVKPDNSTVIIDANGKISGNYEGGHNVKITNNVISDKAFVGTQAEWNALSSAEQNAFDNVNITDDGSAVDNTPGHEVTDETTTFPQRSALKFEGFNVTDDSTNDITKVAEVPYTAGRAIDIDTNKEIAVEDTVKTTFIGTTAEWEALTTAKKAEYELVSLTDDPAGGDMYVEDAVTEDSTNPVTSGAVYNATYLPSGTAITVYCAGRTTTSGNYIEVTVPVKIPTNATNIDFTLTFSSVMIGTSKLDNIIGAVSPASTQNSGQNLLIDFTLSSTQTPNVMIVALLSGTITYTV